MEMLEMIMITIFLQSNEIDVSIHMEIKGLKRGPKATKFVVYPLYNAIFFLGARTKKKKQIMFLFQTFLFKDNKKLAIYSRHRILKFLRSLFNKSNPFLLYEHFLTESCTEANPDNLMSSRYTRRKSLS